MLLRLMKGLCDFEEKSPDQISTIYTQLSKGQHPGVFLLTCSDSRVMPELITQSKPGDIFTHRNVGNMMPPYKPSFDEIEAEQAPPSESAALEFSIEVLKIKEIIICGHSDCGAMKTLLDPHPKLPQTNGWVYQHACASDESDIQLQREDLDTDLSYITKRNILTQIKHLKTYPIIREKLEKNELNLNGWYFDFLKKKVFIYQSSCERFVDLNEALDYAIQTKREKICKAIVTEYLEKLPAPQDKKSYEQRKVLFTTLTTNFHSIWESIQSQVTNNLWDEFKGLFASSQSENFLDNINHCRNYKLNDAETKSLLKNIATSKGYYEYCRSQRLRSDLDLSSNSEEDLEKSNKRAKIA